MASGEEIKEVAKAALFGRANQFNHLISGLVMAFGFLVGFLPIYTGFLERLGGYDGHFRVVDEKIDRIEKDIGIIQADVRAGNANTSVRLDQLLKSLGETRELILTQKGAR